MTRFDGTLWLHPMPPPVVEALREWGLAIDGWRAVAPPRITRTEAEVKLLAFAVGAEPSKPSPPSAEQTDAARSFQEARKKLDMAISEAIGPWMPFEADRKGKRK